MSSRFSRRKIAQAVVERLQQLPREQVLRELAAYLIEERQIKQLPLLMNEIEAQFAERGHVVASVTTAFTLDKELKSTLESYIAELSKAQTVELRETTNPALIGGVIIETPEHYVDSSIATKLKRLKVNSL